MDALARGPRVSMHEGYTCTSTDLRKSDDDDVDDQKGIIKPFDGSSPTTLDILITINPRKGT